MQQITDSVQVSRFHSEPKIILMHVFVILKSNPDQQLFVTHLLCGEISPFVVNVTVMLQTVLALLQTVH
jgi:hypothetical protein